MSAPPSRSGHFSLRCPLSVKFLLLAPLCLAQTPLYTQAPAATQPWTERDLSYSGFNDHPLKASLCRPKDASGPFFAVLVPDHGPVNRNWSSPLFKDPMTGQPMQSHAGKDFAEWMAHRGIGSLRYDKRFIGSQNPKLDISLDAQVGDISASLAHARTLPEAKGKKLLLIGHGEGALLSILAAAHADALVLLALPSQSMAKTIYDQVARQLPQDSAKTHLNYLEDVLSAIRAQKPMPTPDKDVVPALPRLAKSLMAPETLTFVRESLDLEPLQLAARLTRPSLALWCDRDLQSLPPQTLPKSFAPKVLTIANANHLLREEKRALKDLDPLNAMSGFAHDRPMAQLEALEKALQQMGEALK